MATDLESLAPRFLIAMPQLGDPNFHRSLVLMIEHGEAGSSGLVINLSGPPSLVEVAQGHSMQIAPGHAGDNVFVGWPGEPQRGFALHDCETIEEKQQVIHGLYLSFTLDALQPLLQSAGSKIRFCLGYAGWGPKQLEKEIAAG